MSTLMTERDEAAGATPERYHYTRVVEVGGRTVRARVERGLYLDQSCAVAEVLNGQMTWTSLAADAPANWWYDTPSPASTVRTGTVLRPLTDRLLQRAAGILADPPTTTTISPHMHGAISALLATSYGFNAERRIDPDEITWAYTYGGALHIIEHPDGAVTFTKAHHEDCPFLISQDRRDCDDECDFAHPADAERDTHS
ncbi:hypothetical protein [Amycolatopsis sp. PS_44_ISF1]|uniref:hypothetical protein n=1 Tax=Amycolatopsis sp. PS_44_ISF1 TaxID=2974917 RepID=UPI0028DDB4FF|nr:hypothetical protein [Amycolatopsis sp. PS_44_ISF1]MDT8913580.1 hypothetical protein [Amycolatopsis sp. PS_44_ISF1]